MKTGELTVLYTLGGITCLAMAMAPDNINSVLNVIVYMQQQNHRLLYDVPNSKIGLLVSFALRGSTAENPPEAALCHVYLHHLY